MAIREPARDRRGRRIERNERQFSLAKDAKTIANWPTSLSL